MTKKTNSFFGKSNFFIISLLGSIFVSTKKTFLSFFKCIPNWTKKNNILLAESDNF